MDWYKILSLLLGSGVLGYIVARIKKTEAENRALRVGLQALLRDRLVSIYDYWSDKGYAPIHVKDNFENIWTQYHTLGKNGVMDDIHIKFMKLPTEEV